MHLLCTISNPIGTYCMQGGHVGRPSQDHDHCRPTTTNDSKEFESHIGKHKILLKFYKGICTNHCTDGEVIEKICEFWMEWRVPKEPWKTKEKYGCNTNMSFSIMEEGVPCPCRCFVSRTGSDISPTSRSINRPPNHVCDSKVVHCREKLYNDKRRRVGDGICVAKIPPQPVRGGLQNVYWTLNIEILS